MPAQFAEIAGDAGDVLITGGTAGKISRWKIVPTRMKPDGTPELQFKCQFSWRNDVTLGMISRGVIKGRVQVKMRTKVGLESIDIVNWDQWRLDGGILYLDNVMYFDSKVLTTRTVSR